eukprot:1278651-Pyramimonas_sp.AAC.1
MVPPAEGAGGRCDGNPRAVGGHVGAAHAQRDSGACTAPCVRGPAGAGRLPRAPPWAHELRLRHPLRPRELRGGGRAGVCLAPIYKHVQQELRDLNQKIVSTYEPKECSLIHL